MERGTHLYARKWGKRNRGSRSASVWQAEVMTSSHAVSSVSNFPMSDLIFIVSLRWTPNQNPNYERRVEIQHVDLLSDAHRCCCISGITKFALPQPGCLRCTGTWNEPCARGVVRFRSMDHGRIKGRCGSVYHHELAYRCTWYRRYHCIITYPQSIARNSGKKSTTSGCTFGEMDQFSQSSFIGGSTTRQLGSWAFWIYTPSQDFVNTAWSCGSVNWNAWRVPVILITPDNKSVLKSQQHLHNQVRNHSSYHQ